jgi:hypothetical protein
MEVKWRWSENENEADHRKHYKGGHLPDRQTYFFAIYVSVSILELELGYGIKNLSR